MMEHKEVIEVIKHLKETYKSLEIKHKKEKDGLKKDILQWYISKQIPDHLTRAIKVLESVDDVEGIKEVIENIPEILTAKAVNKEMKEIIDKQILHSTTPHFKSATETMNYMTKSDIVEYRLSELVRKISQAISKWLKGEE